MQDILIISVDGLAGFSEAIAAAYPQTEAQRCIIHQIRSSTRYVSHKDVEKSTILERHHFPAFMVSFCPVY